jgi:hypothetical protein
MYFNGKAREDSLLISIEAEKTDVRVTVDDLYAKPREENKVD